MMCPGSMMVHAKGMHHLFKDLNQLKHSLSSNSSQVHQVLTFLQPLFLFFVIKVKLLRKSSKFFLLNVTLRTYMVFKKNNEFSFVQVAKILKSKDVAKDLILSTATTDFRILIF